MKKFSVVLAAVVLLGFLLAWNPGVSEALPYSYTPDPAQLATGVVLPVKVNTTTGTDTVLVLFRDTADNATATGTTADIKLTFYTSACAKGPDATDNLTRADVDLGDNTRAWVSELFSVTGNGVVLGFPLYYSTNTQIRWGMSGLVVDVDLGAIYETQGYPALTGVLGSATTPVTDGWAGFSSQDFEDYYLQGGGWATTVQLVCPDSTLRTDMNSIAPIRGSLSATVAPIYEISTINIYGIDEVLINSLHDKTCSCFTEDPGSMSTYMAQNASILGTFHIDLSSSQEATGARVITLDDYYAYGRIRRATDRPE